MDSHFETTDLLVFSHLRWDFVFQRPQHLMIRHALHRRVYYIEEPIFGVASSPRIHVRDAQSGVKVVVPYLPDGLDEFETERGLARLMDELVSEEDIRDFTAWYYTPMAYAWSRHLEARAVIYDCMDELSKFLGAPPQLLKMEAELMKHADLVFTGGQSLYEAKKTKHANIHPFPSSIDFPHFARARDWLDEPADQAFIPHPRLGYFGVIDERMDIKLVDEVARLMPEWQIVMIGPVVKIDPATLPRRANIHYLGKKDYQELPMYLAGWDLAIMPFARNESTRFISPTKTPEYLAAGRPVVSTSIRDVVKPYGQMGLVHIADRPVDFIQHAEKAMKERSNTKWRQRVDQFLAGMSWDRTWQKMAELEHSLEIDRPREPKRLRVAPRESYAPGPQ